MKDESALIYDLRSYMDKEKLVEAGFDTVFRLGEGRPCTSRRNDLNM